MNPTQPLSAPVDNEPMTRPREVLAGHFYLITRRCTQRQFLLRPDPATNNAFIYCLGEAANRFGIDVLLPMAESNHHHTVIFDRDGTMPVFIEHFHKLFARSQNALRGRWENFWSSEEVCIVRLVDREAVIEKLVYTATNPVKDRLVERTHHWPGVNGYPRLLAGRALQATRPTHFFRKEGGTMPEKVELPLVIPPELGAREEVIATLRVRVEAIERAAAEERRRTGARVLGRRCILEQKWEGSPESPEPRRNLRPRFAAQDPVARVAALLRHREFLNAYKDARQRWLTGAHAAFPVGTYWLRKFASVPIAVPIATSSN